MRWYLGHGGHGAAAIDALTRFAAAAVIGQECHQIVHRVELRAIDHEPPILARDDQISMAQLLQMERQGQQFRP